MPFGFENMKLNVEGFKDLVRNWWEGYNVKGFEAESTSLE